MKDIIKIEQGYCYCCVCKDKNCAMIYNLYIYKCFRRQGYAKELVEKAIKKIRATKYKQDIKIVAIPEEESISKENLIKFYENMGLKVIE